MKTSEITLDGNMVRKRVFPLEMVDSKESGTGW